MTTRTRTVDKAGKKKNALAPELMLFPPYTAPAEAESGEEWRGNGNHSSPTGVADMDNLVYLYCLKWARLPRLMLLKRRAWEPD